MFTAKAMMTTLGNDWLDVNCVSDVLGGKQVTALHANFEDKPINFKDGKLYARACVGAASVKYKLQIHVSKQLVRYVVPRCCAHFFRNVRDRKYGVMFCVHDNLSRVKGRMHCVEFNDAVVSTVFPNGDSTFIAIIKIKN